jgi:hypothetical protein
MRRLNDQKLKELIESIDHDPEDVEPPVSDEEVAVMREAQDEFLCGHGLISAMQVFERACWGDPYWAADLLRGAMNDDS